MANEEVLGALRSALERGEPMTRAIKTLRNAHYKKEDIDEAAAIVAEENIQPVFQQKNLMPKFTLQKSAEVPTAPTAETKPAKSNKKLFQKLPQQEKSTAKISNYEDKKPKKKSKLIFVIIFFLFLLAISLTTLFFFKDEILSLLSKFFPQ